MAFLIFISWVRVCRDRVRFLGWDTLRLLGSCYTLSNCFYVLHFRIRTISVFTSAVRIRISLYSTVTWLLLKIYPLVREHVHVPEK